MIKLLNRGKVRDLYEISGNLIVGNEDTSFNYQSKNYRIADRIVLEPKTNAVIGTLFDDSEMEKVKLAVLREENLDALLDKMFLGYTR